MQGSRDGRDSLLLAVDINLDWDLVAALLVDRYNRLQIQSKNKQKTRLNLTDTERRWEWNPMQCSQLTSVAIFLAVSLDLAADTRQAINNRPLIAPG